MVCEWEDIVPAVSCFHSGTACAAGSECPPQRRVSPPCCDRLVLVLLVDKSWLRMTLLFIKDRSCLSKQEMATPVIINKIKLLSFFLWNTRGKGARSERATPYISMHLVKAGWCFKRHWTLWTSNSGTTDAVLWPHIESYPLDCVQWQMEWNIQAFQKWMLVYLKYFSLAQKTVKRSSQKSNPFLQVCPQFYYLTNTLFFLKYFFSLYSYSYRRIT